MSGRFQLPGQAEARREFAGGIFQYKFGKHLTKAARGLPVDINERHPRIINDRITGGGCAFPCVHELSLAFLSGKVITSRRYEPSGGK